jgi:hypothetical protein
MKLAAFLVLLFFYRPLKAQDTAEKSLVLGSRGSYFLQTDDFDNALNFVQMKYRDEVLFDTSTLKRNFEFRTFDPVSTSEHTFVDPVNVSLEILFDTTSFQIGFIRYRFSETFGLQILDVANPRDYSDYVLNDLSWAKRSVFGLNMKKTFDRLEALWMLTLWGNGDRLPYRNSPYDLTEGQFGYEGGVVDRPWFKDLEYGVRFKYLFENGLDLSFLGYHHFARPTVLSLSGNPFTGFTLEHRDRLVNSLGAAASYVVGDWVLRGDILYTMKDNFQTGAITFEERNHYQQLLGLDRLWDTWSLGAQFQNDFAYHRNFIGLKIESTYFEFWTPSTMFFLGDRHRDQWLQVKNSFEYESWNMNVIADFLNGEKTAKGLFGLYRTDDRVLFEVTKTY